MLARRRVCEDREKHVRRQESGKCVGNDAKVENCASRVRSSENLTKSRGRSIYGPPPNVHNQTLKTCGKTNHPGMQ